MSERNFELERRQLDADQAEAIYIRALARPGDVSEAARALDEARARLETTINAYALMDVAEQREQEQARQTVQDAILDDVRAALDVSISPFANRLNAITADFKAAMTTDTPIHEHVLTAVSAARQRLESAQAHKAAVQGEADAIRSRIAAAENEMNGITAARIAGKQSAQQEARYVALAGDVAALRPLATAAQARADAIDFSHEARLAADAELYLQRHAAESKAAALVGIAAQAEILLLETLQAIEPAKRAAGKRIVTAHDVFPIAAPLESFVSKNMPVGMTRR